MVRPPALLYRTVLMYIKFHNPMKVGENFKGSAQPVGSVGPSQSSLSSTGRLMLTATTIESRRVCGIGGRVY